MNVSILGNDVKCRMSIIQNGCFSNVKYSITIQLYHISVSNICMLTSIVLINTVSVNTKLFHGFMKTYCVDISWKCC